MDAQGPTRVIVMFEQNGLMVAFDGEGLVVNIEREYEELFSDYSHNAEGCRSSTRMEITFPDTVTMYYQAPPPKPPRPGEITTSAPLLPETEVTP